MIFVVRPVSLAANLIGVDKVVSVTLLTIVAIQPHIILLF